MPIGYSIDVVLPMVLDGYEEKINKIARKAVGNAMVKYIEAAAGAVPVWTGYSRAVWEGIAAHLDEVIGLPREPKINLNAERPWYMPRWPVSNPSTVVAEDTEQQQDRGFEDGYNALLVAVTPDSIYLSIEIPEYTGELNYAIREAEWESLAHGIIAFNEAMDTFKVDLSSVLLYEHRIR